jgi:hypothetical protein
MRHPGRPMTYYCSESAPRQSPFLSSLSSLPKFGTQVSEKGGREENVTLGSRALILLGKCSPAHQARRSLDGGERVFFRTCIWPADFSAPLYLLSTHLCPLRGIPCVPLLAIAPIQATYHCYRKIEEEEEKEEENSSPIWMVRDTAVMHGGKIQRGQPRDLDFDWGFGGDCDCGACLVTGLRTHAPHTRATIELRWGDQLRHEPTTPLSGRILARLVVCLAAWLPGWG